MNNAELAVIGSFIVPGHQAEIATSIEPKDFSDPDCRSTFTLLRDFYFGDGVLDEVSLQRLPESERVVAVQSLSGAYNPDNWDIYVGIVKESAAITRAHEIASLIPFKAFREDIQPLAEELIAALGTTTHSNKMTMAQAVEAFINEKQKPRQYLKTGYARLDDFTYIDRGDFVIVGGRPSSGKTAFTLNLALNMAKTGLQVVYFTLETAKTKIKDRLLTAYCALDYDRVKCQMLRPEEWARVAENAREMSNLPITIVHAAGMTVSQIRAEATLLKADVVFIDYIGLISDKENGRYEKMTSISIALHNFAQQSGITVFGLSQLNRGEKTDMTSLRESGQIEQDADLIMLLSYDPDTAEFVVNIVKNKEGQAGKISMEFRGETQQVFDLESRYE